MGCLEQPPCYGENIKGMIINSQGALNVTQYEEAITEDNPVLSIYISDDVSTTEYHKEITMLGNAQNGYHIEETEYSNVVTTPGENCRIPTKTIAIDVIIPESWDNSIEEEFNSIMVVMEQRLGERAEVEAWNGLILEIEWYGVNT
jgi:hypothetical protein